MRIALLLLLIGFSACQNETPELKSPCVGINDSPCVKRAPEMQYGVA